MAVQRRVNWISEQMVQLPDIRMVESAASNDWDQYTQAVLTGTSQGYIVRGFNILMANAIGNAASNLQLQVDPGSLMHILASQSGTVYMVPPGTPAQQLNSAINSNVTGSFSPNSINYVSIDYIRFLDDTTDAQVYIWDPTADTTTTINAPRGNILTYIINISTVAPTNNLLPVAAVLTDGGNNVLSISDERWLFCRLGTGGTNPNPFYVYPWPEGRSENSFTSTSDSVDPFSGGDKSISNLKELLNALMSSILEIKGSTYWYSPTNGESLLFLREDLGNTVITGAGSISQGILPNSSPILVTTGNVVTGSNQLTNLASVAGLSDGDFIFLSGLPSNTTILSISGSTVTMSADSTITGTGITVTFYDPSVITAPGQVNWNLPIYIDVVGSALSYELLANPSSTDITLANDQAAYITLIRSQPITPNLIFTNGNTDVVSVGAIPWTSLLVAGDYIKLTSDTDAGYYEIQSVNSASDVTLVTPFAETSTGAGGAQAQYAFGSYSASATPSTSRDIFIADRADVPINANTFWLFLREDNGGSAKVYIKFLGLALDDGDSQQIGGDVPEQLLQYIGSPSLAASAPQYVAALDPGSVQQITSITTGTGASMTSDQYFLIYSSANARTYTVWASVDGGGSQPVVPFTNIYLEWSVLSSDSATQTAAKLAVVLSSTTNRDFSAVSSGATVTVTNHSAGSCSNASNVSVGAPFAISITQAGTGQGNYNIQDGDNLTLAIKELDDAVGLLEATNESANYEETVTVVASGATPPTTINGPVSPGTDISLPNNTRAGNVQQFYQVNSAKLQVFLNGQELVIGDDYTEVGSDGALSNEIQIQIGLVVADILEFRISTGGGSGLGGPEGPPGPTGPTGPPGSDAVGGPINISTKTANYTVLSTDNVLLANCASNSITFSLPTAASSTGRVFYFKKTDSTLNAMIILANGSDLIDGSSSQTTVVRYQSYTLITDGTEWYIF
jgi:hypothetical protein